MGQFPLGSTAAPHAVRNALLSAQACWLEGGFSLADCRSIVWVIKRRARRAGWTYDRMLLKYSALDSSTDRAAFARQLPAGPVAAWGGRANERWAMLRAVARGALEGRIRSATPGARHWGSRVIAVDVRRAKRAIQAGRWRLLASDTLNAFYAEVRR